MSLAEGGAAGNVQGAAQLAAFEMGYGHLGDEVGSRSSSSSSSICDGSGGGGSTTPSSHSGAGAGAGAGAGNSSGGRRKKDYQLAAKWHKRVLASSDDPPLLSTSNMAVGRLYQVGGHGLTADGSPDWAVAFKWYKRASRVACTDTDTGGVTSGGGACVCAAVGEALRRMGLLLQSGGFGVRRDARPSATSPAPPPER